MLSYQQALKEVTQSIVTSGVIRKTIDESCGYVLARDVYSDIDMPPFDKSAVDGYACRVQDINTSLKCTEIISAGQLPKNTVKKGECIHIMTGCIIPEGADCVLMVEHTEKLSDGSIRFLKNKTSPNICYKGEDITAGEKVLESGTLLKPEHLAILASVGCTLPFVYEKATAGIISTGDELVEPVLFPGPAQIRNSNASQLKAQLFNAGFETKYYGIAPDNPEKTLELIYKSLSENTVTIITGGVSMGEFDFVPAMLEKAGIEILFKSIAVQPGRPTVFGKNAANHYCFGLPGNPVSSFVQLHLLVFPLMFGLSGNNYAPIQLKLPLTHDFKRLKSGRMSVVPAKINNDGSISQIDYHGSAHIHAYINANAFIMIEPEVTEIKKGELVNARLI